MHDVPLNNLPLMPSVLNLVQDEQQTIIDLLIDEDLRCFQGHFDDAPVVAGVVQLDWAVLFAQQHFFPTSKVGKVGSLKFQKLMLPKMKVQLVINKISDTKFSFKYSADDANFSSAKVEMI